MHTDRKKVIDFLLLMSRMFNVSDLEIDNLNKKFPEIFLEFGSETPDNIECINNIIIYKDKNSGDGVEFFLKNSKISIFQILNCAGDDIPPQVLKYYPNIKTEEWNACIRMMVLIGSALTSSYDDD